MDPMALGWLLGSIFSSVLIPIAIFVIFRNLLGFTPLKKKTGILHGIAAVPALIGALAAATSPVGVIFALLALFTTTGFVVWSYKKAKRAATISS